MGYDANYWNSGAFMDTPQVNTYQQQFNQQPVGPQINDTNNGLMQAASPGYDPNVFLNQYQVDPTQSIPGLNNQVNPNESIPGLNNQVNPNQGIPFTNNQVNPAEGIPFTNNQVTPNEGIPFTNNQVDPIEAIPSINNVVNPTEPFPNVNNPAFVEGDELIGTGVSLFDNPHGQTDLSSWGFNNKYMQGAGSYTPRLGLFGKEGGFGSGEGWFSRIGQGGEGFMGKFGTGEGKMAKAFGGGDTTEDAADLSDIDEKEEEDEMGFGGKLLGGLASGLQNMGSFQYGMF